MLCGVVILCHILYCLVCCLLYLNEKVKRMQRLGTEAIRTQIQPSKPKGEITNVTNGQNTKRANGRSTV